MTKVWTKRYQPPGRDNLIVGDAIFVRVASFTFKFSTVERLRACLAYYEQKTRPSSRYPARRLAAEFGPHWRKLRGWEIERWFERLPMYLLERPRRRKVVKALSEALALVESGEL